MLKKMKYAKECRLDYRIILRAYVRVLSNMHNIHLWPDSSYEKLKSTRFDPDDSVSLVG